MSLGETIFDWVKSIAIAVLIAVLLRTFVFSLIRVDGQSMLETLQNNDVLFVTMFDHYIGNYERGEIVICNYPNRKGYRVKRVIGLPGETIEIRRGVTYINGEALAEDFVVYPSNDDYAARTLGEDEYFLMGDNRAVSRDSRANDVGPIARKEIQGVVRVVLFPFKAIRLVH